MNNKISQIVALMIFIAVQPATAQEPWVLDGFEMPESVLVDTDRAQLIVSNIVGNPGEADATGYLSRVSLDGTLIERQWVTGLDAPKGMALIDHEILVADLGRLHRIDADTGVIIESIIADGALFLNDVTSDADVAWISDLLTNTIWRYSDGELVSWLQNDELSYPNGLLIDGQRLLVGSWGVGLHDDFSTDELGALLSVDLESKAIATVVPSVGNIDGIANVQGVLYVSDWLSGALLEVNEDRDSVVERQRFPKGLADISSNEGALYLPLMLDGQVKVLSMSVTAASE